MEIKVVDYSDFISGNAERKAKFVQEIGNAFEEIGFVIVKNHGVSPELRASLISITDKFFNLPDEVKLKYEDLSNGGQRGYISKGRETAKGFKKPDLKEFYHIGQRLSEGSDLQDVYPDNIWPKEVEEFRPIGWEVYETFENTGRDLLRATALYLGLDEFYFDNKIKDGNSILRLLYYYPVEDMSQIDPDAVRAAAHEDINLITLLMGGSASGLQAKSRDGEWIDVSPTPDQIVINIGDMLQRLTNGKLVSTTHRVINLDPKAMLKPRISTPFFLHPRSDMDLTSLESCIDEQTPKRFADMTAGEYLDERIKELGLKK